MTKPQVLLITLIIISKLSWCQMINLTFGEVSIFLGCFDVSMNKQLKICWLYVDPCCQQRRHLLNILKLVAPQKGHLQKLFFEKYVWSDCKRLIDKGPVFKHLDIKMALHWSQKISHFVYLGYLFILLFWIVALPRVKE